MIPQDKDTPDMDSTAMDSREITAINARQMNAGTDPDSGAKSKITGSEPWFPYQGKRIVLHEEENPESDLMASGCHLKQRKLSYVPLPEEQDAILGRKSMSLRRIWGPMNPIWHIFATAYHTRTGHQLPGDASSPENPLFSAVLSGDARQPVKVLFILYSLCVKGSIWISAR